MTSLREKERQYYWRVSQQLQAAIAAQDDEAFMDARRDMEGIAIHGADDAMRRAAREALAGSHRLAEKCVCRM